MSLQLQCKIQNMADEATVDGEATNSDEQNMEKDTGVTESNCKSELMEVENHEKEPTLNTSQPSNSNHHQLSQPSMEVTSAQDVVCNEGASNESTLEGAEKLTSNKSEKLHKDDSGIYMYMYDKKSQDEGSSDDAESRAVPRLADGDGAEAKSTENQELNESGDVMSVEPSADSVEQESRQIDREKHQGM